MTDESMHNINEITRAACKWIKRTSCQFLGGSIALGLCFASAVAASDFEWCETGRKIIDRHECIKMEMAPYEQNNPHYGRYRERLIKNVCSIDVWLGQCVDERIYSSDNPKTSLYCGTPLLPKSISSMERHAVSIDTLAHKARGIYRLPRVTWWAWSCE